MYILMNIWIVGKFLMKTVLPNKEAFYSELYLLDTTDKDYTCSKSV